MKNITESLAGRVAILNLLGFSGREARQEPPRPMPISPDSLAGSVPLSGLSLCLDPDDLYRRIWMGGFPALLSGAVQDREVFFSSYLQTYLLRDVSDLAQIGDRGAFLMFLKACAARTGQMLNLSELARDTQVSVNTAKHWLSILEASYQIILLPPYSTNRTKRLMKRPKLYFLDTGLCSYLTGWTSPQTLASGAMAGAILETFVLGEILKSWWNLGRNPLLTYFRDQAGTEIDFVLEQDDRLLPMEVKKAATIRSDWKKPFETLHRLHGNLGQAAILYLGPSVVPMTQSLTAVPVSVL